MAVGVAVAATVGLAATSTETCWLSQPVVEL